MNENTAHDVASPNTPIRSNLSDSEVVDIELAKGRLINAIEKVQIIPAVKTETLVAKALSNTVREILIDAGVTTAKEYYNTFADKMESQVDKVYELFGIEVIEIEDDEADITD